MGFLKNKKQTTSASNASSAQTAKDRFNEKTSYESLYDEYNKTSTGKPGGAKPRPPAAAAASYSREKPAVAKSSSNEPSPAEARDEEPMNRSDAKMSAIQAPSKGKTTGLSSTPQEKTDTTRTTKEPESSTAAMAAALPESNNTRRKSPVTEVLPPMNKKSKNKRRTRRRHAALSESESEESLSSVSSSASDESQSDEETDISFEESYTEDEISETSTFETTESAIKSDPEHQAVVMVNEHGNVEKLRLEVIRSYPKASSPKSVVIKVEASSITLQDCMIRRGKWYDMQSLPFVPGSDVVGIIHEIGNEAVRSGGFQIGDRVAAVVPSGGNAKYISLTYEQIIRVPDTVDPVIALSLSSTYVPAREALDLARKMNTPFTGANILVIGGNGPSGLATIELAGLEGAHVFTTADERHHEYLAGLGARCFPIDPKKWLPTLRGKMDVVIDSVCLDGFESSALALNDEGMLVCTGMSALYTQGNIPAFGLRDVRDMKAFYVKLRAKYLMNSIYYDKMERFTTAPNEYAQHFRYLCHLASKETIKPIISARASLNMVAFMHRAIEHGDTPHGVCVCTPWITRKDL